MDATDKRRVKRAVIVLVFTVLLLSGYIGTWLAVSRAAYDGIISAPVAEAVAPAFRPIVWYCEHDWIGVDSLQRIWWRTNPAVSRPDGNGGKAFYPNPNSWPFSPGL